MLNKIIYTLLLICLSVACASAASGTYTNDLLAKATQGDAGAQNDLGICYRDGDGGEKDEKRACYWFSKAAEQGNALGQYNLGICYKDGIGGGKDEKKACSLFSKAAEQGNALGQNNLGWCYENGIGVKKDDAKAIYWYTKAAEQGQTDAQDRLKRFNSITQNSGTQNGAVVIEPGKKGNGYSWSPDGLTVTITGAYEKYILSNAISGSITVNVDADEITLNGNGIPIAGIRGQPTLDLENVYVNGATYHKYGMNDMFDGFFGITDCRNIKSSSIVLEHIRGETPIYGIEHLWGNLDDTTVTVTGDTVYGVEEVIGKISGGVFTLTSDLYAVGLHSVYGEISGGVFTVISKQSAAGVETVYGEGKFSDGKISGGKFFVTADTMAFGVKGITFPGSEISGGEFTVTGNEAYGIWYYGDTGKISGGEFTITGKKEAIAIHIGDRISGGKFIVNGVRQLRPT